MNATLNWGAVLGASSQPAVVEVAQSLLRVCRADAVNLRNLVSMPMLYLPRQAIRKEAYTFFREVNSDELDALERSALVELLSRHSRQHPASFVALAVAEGLDEALGKRFNGWFRARGTFSVGPNEVFPVLDVPLAEYEEFGGRMNTNADRLELPVDATRHLRLMPEQSPCSVPFTYEADDVLANLGLYSKIGVALPNQRITLDHSVSELRWERYTLEGRPLFRNVLPVDEEEQQRLIHSLVDAAARQRVSLLLLPELSLSPAGLAALGQHLMTSVPLDSRPVVVAGSCHMSDSDGRLRNRTMLLLPDGRRLLLHDKFEEFSFPDRQDADGSKPTVERFEDIHRERALRVHVSGTWAWASLICKDAMPRQIGALLAELRLRLVLIPAMSPKTQVFDVNARWLSVHAQAIAVVANAADGETASRAQSVIVSQPVRDESYCSSLLRSEVSPPCLVLIDVKGNGLMKC
jgi:predicted amidohydrolase